MKRFQAALRRGPALWTAWLQHVLLRPGARNSQRPGPASRASGQTDPATGPGLTRADAAERLLLFSQKFAERSAGMEAGFVALGQTLRNLYATAGELAQVVRERAGNLQVALLQSRIAGEDGLAAKAFDELQIGLRETADLLHSLQTIGDALQQLRPQMQSVRRIGLFLKASVFSFAVESARTTECQLAFGAFVEELRALAGQIGTGCEKLHDHVQATEATQGHGRAAMRASLEQMHLLAEEVQSTARATSSEAQALLDGSLGALRQTEECTGHIAQSAEEAVYHLQFGDIVRQKLEHITSSLQKAAQLIGDPQAETEAAAKASEADCLIGIQVGQLELIRTEVLTAHSKLNQAFENIASQTDRLLQVLQSAQDRSHASNPIQSLQSDSVRLEELQGQSRRLQQEARGTAQLAAEASRQLRRHLDQLNEINREMHLQALNAIVKTTSLRGEGATLEVLSMEVASLFRESNRAVSAIVQTIEQILQAAHAAGSQPADPVWTDAAGSGESRFKMDLERIRHAYEQFSRASDQAVLLAEKQRGVLSQSSRCLQFLSGLSENFAGQCHDLTALRALLTPVRAKAVASTAGALELLDQHYTMQSERDVHETFRRTLGPGDARTREPAAAGEIELFETASSTPPSAPAGSELGQPAFASTTELRPVDKQAATTDDNIEFF
ncbi:MAG: hypothetical protein U1G07_08200 [Verrucomicrobiota bacterium]